MLATVLETENVKIYNQMQNYFKELEKVNRDFEEKETGTRKVYEADIRLFFELMRNKEKSKELEYLTMDDIKVTQEDMEEYVDLLCDLKDKNGKNRFANRTINGKITALKGLMRYLKRKKIIGDHDISYLELIKCQKERNNQYDALEVHEVLKMAELAKYEREKGKIKSLLIMFAFKTGLRIAEALNVKWTDFIIREDDVLIDGVGKGNKEFEVLITKDFYEELLELKNEIEKVFDISDRRVADMMKRMKIKMGIENRNIVFHSLRKAFGTYIYRSTGGDINAARIALRHSSIMTTQIYLAKEDYKLHTSIFSIEKADNELYKKVSHEELVEAIGKMNKDQQLMLNMKLSELLKGNK